jgi:hypothetical protein
MRLKGVWLVGLFGHLLCDHRQARPLSRVTIEDAGIANSSGSVSTVSKLQHIQKNVVRNLGHG